MGFDFEKLKSKFSANKQASASNGLPGETKGKGLSKQLLNYPALRDVKRGLEDIQVVAHEGKYSLFAKQVVFLLIVFLGVRFVCAKFDKSKAEIKDKVAAINIQQNNEEDYLENKQHLLQLEPLFPDISQKNDWMLRRLINIFETHKITPDVDGNVKENAEKTYTLFAQPVRFQQSFSAIGKLIADIENGDDFLRISEITIDKQISPEALGENKVTAVFNTVFPKEKYAPKLFKDYAKLTQKAKDANTQQKDQTGGRKK